MNELMQGVAYGMAGYYAFKGLSSLYRNIRNHANPDIAMDLVERDNDLADELMLRHTQNFETNYVIVLPAYKEVGTIEDTVLDHALKFYAEHNEYGRDMYSPQKVKVVIATQGNEDEQRNKRLSEIISAAEAWYDSQMDFSVERRGMAEYLELFKEHYWIKPQKGSGYYHLQPHSRDFFIRQVTDDLKQMYPTTREKMHEVMQTLEDKIGERQNVFLHVHVPAHPDRKRGQLNYVLNHMQDPEFGIASEFFDSPTLFGVYDADSRWDWRALRTIDYKMQKERRQVEKQLSEIVSLGYRWRNEGDQAIEEEGLDVAEYSDLFNRCLHNNSSDHVNFAKRIRRKVLPTLEDTLPVGAQQLYLTVQNWDELNTRGKSNAAYQTSYLLDGWVDSLLSGRGLMQWLGHGSFYDVDFLQSIGGFQDNGGIEDSSTSALAKALDKEILPIGLFDVNTAPQDKDSQIAQWRNWYRGTAADLIEPYRQWRNGNMGSYRALTTIVSNAINKIEWALNPILLNPIFPIYAMTSADSLNIPEIVQMAWTPLILDFYQYNFGGLMDSMNFAEKSKTLAPEHLREYIPDITLSEKLKVSLMQRSAKSRSTRGAQIGLWGMIKDYATKGTINPHREVKTVRSHGN